MKGTLGVTYEKNDIKQYSFFSKWLKVARFSNLSAEKISKYFGTATKSQ